MPRAKKMRVAWWALKSDAVNPMLHAVRDDRGVAMCGGKKTKKSYEVRGPVTIGRHIKCARCEAQLGRIALMQ